MIPSDLSLWDFHKIIQVTMGWTNSHLHQFIKDGIYYTKRYPEDDNWEDMESVDYEQPVIRVSEFLPDEKGSMLYEYDFGDGWIHRVTLEKILPTDDTVSLPVCLDGKMHCPPEDCGGVWGYAGMLEILKHPEHEQHEDYLAWLGGEFDPEYFNKDEVNKLLQQKGYGFFEE